MPGNRGRVRLILQPRDELLLSALCELRVVDREQAQKLAGLSSIRRANARLLALTRAGFLRRSFIGHAGHGRRALYRLPRDRARASPLFLEHQLALNDVYLCLRAADGIQLRTWRTFGAPPCSGVPLIPDAYAELSTQGDLHPLFIEIDRGTESGRIWRGKAEAYQRLAFSGEFEHIFARSHFRVAVLTTSPRRVENIRRAVATVTEKFFWFSTIEIFNRGSFFDPVWLRPTGSAKVPLL